MSEHLMRFGIRNNELVSISDVFSGLKCNCTCPSCGAILVAKKGKKKEHHFAHHSGADCNHGCESGLHIMAKTILEKTKELFVPDKENDKEGKTVCFSDAEIESRKFSSFVPDVILTNGSEYLCVEILVTHSVDEEKSLKIEEEKANTVEIDLSGLIDDYDENKVLNVIKSGRYTKWIYNESIAKRKKEQLLIDELCDHIVCYNDICECPMLNRPVSFDYGNHSCHECNYFENRSALDYRFVRPCKYREKELLKNDITDFKKDIERKNGMIVFVEVFVNDEWQPWKGNINKKLSLDKNIISEMQKNDNTRDPSIEGKTVFELWEKDFSAMIVGRIDGDTVMLINGINGKMKTKREGQTEKVIGKYCEKSYGKYVYSPREYAVWDADKPVWKLIWNR